VLQKNNQDLGRYSFRTLAMSVSLCDGNESSQQNHRFNKARFIAISAQLGESLVPIRTEQSNFYRHGGDSSPRGVRPCASHSDVASIP